MIETHLQFYQRWHDLAKPYFEWQFEQFGSHLGRRVADLGCGLGNFTDFLLSKEFYLGIDADVGIINLVRKKYRFAHNVRFTAGDITSREIVAVLKEERIDSIMCINVLEHIEKDGESIDRMLAVLPPQGRLCLLVPALQLNYGSLDVLDHHYRRYNKREITGKLLKAGADILSVRYFNLIGALGWFIKGNVLRQKTHSDHNYRIMNKIIPMSKTVEKLFTIPFGQSLVAIATKK